MEIFVSFSPRQISLSSQDTKFRARNRCTPSTRPQILKFYGHLDTGRSHLTQIRDSSISWPWLRTAVALGSFCICICFFGSDHKSWLGQFDLCLRRPENLSLPRCIAVSCWNSWINIKAAENLQAMAIDRTIELSRAMLHCVLWNWNLEPGKSNPLPHGTWGSARVRVLTDACPPLRFGLKIRLGSCHSPIEFVWHISL